MEAFSQNDFPGRRVHLTKQSQRFWVHFPDIHSIKISFAKVKMRNEMVLTSLAIARGLKGPLAKTAAPLAQA
jgi:hypothetical protein